MQRAHYYLPELEGAGHTNPPSAPPAIPPIIINPFNRQIPSPAIDPRQTPPGPPVICHFSMSAACRVRRNSL
jgi:hypothetical protein